ncbi:class I SAM-dependent methyltransferase [Lacihabitans soyangensis]|uniref:Class I SAM-dependent methyltransferase n=1 Tax=Lacihabitans soyangensis TaxID=869394 RepID=A0AAE3KRS2_9BACT|nr:class I SAM-dependent methyltransferase [Lacihabitans soyangensis]MCP9762398.1 class I SAM-dependent methyltransferase [Lacihabitans soyangensis]
MEQNFDRKNHWENIYQTKEFSAVSWYQPIPQTSLDLILGANLAKDARIIDIGGGDSFLVDHLLQLGFLDVTVLDISSKAIEKAKVRLGENASKVKWLVADASNFESDEKYDFWHDRAAFHFLKDKKEVESYVKKASQLIAKNGTLAIGTFSENGPLKCSGIEIQQYSETSLSEVFSLYFDKQKCFTVDHQTPSGSLQNFVFCTFVRK